VNFSKVYTEDWYEPAIDLFLRCSYKENYYDKMFEIGTYLFKLPFFNTQNEKIELSKLNQSLYNKNDILTDDEITAITTQVNTDSVDGSFEYIPFLINSARFEYKNKYDIENLYNGGLVPIFDVTDIKEYYNHDVITNETMFENFLTSKNDNYDNINIQKDLNLLFAAFESGDTKMNILTFIKANYKNTTLNDFIYQFNIYNAGTTYSENDIISDGDNIFFSLQDSNTGNTPDASDSNNKFWKWVSSDSFTLLDIIYNAITPFTQKNTYILKYKINEMLDNLVLFYKIKMDDFIKDITNNFDTDFMEFYTSENWFDGVIASQTGFDYLFDLSDNSVFKYNDTFILYGMAEMIEKYSLESILKPETLRSDAVTVFDAFVSYIEYLHDFKNTILFSNQEIDYKDVKELKVINQEDVNGFIEKLSSTMIS